MKKILVIIGVAASLATVKAQIVGTNSFFNSLGSYFTSFNTNLDSAVAESRGSLWTGADSLQGGNTPLANSLGLAYYLYAPTNSQARIGLESVTRNSGVAGTLVSEQAGFELGFIVHDVTICIYGDGLYDFQPETHLNKKGKKLTDSPFDGEIGLRIRKNLTEHTYIGTGIGAQLPQNRQVFSVFTGFTF